eukprot:218573-Hanusia_phi.AAC.1
MEILTAPDQQIQRTPRMQQFTDPAINLCVRASSDNFVQSLPPHNNLTSINISFLTSSSQPLISEGHVAQGICSQCKAAESCALPWPAVDDANVDFDDDMRERSSEMNFSCEEEEPPPPPTTSFALQCNAEKHV